MENSEKLINTMKTKNIRPIPKWHFTMKGMLIATAIIISVILGGLAFSIILFTVQQLGFDLISHMSHSRLEFILGLLPFLWIGFLIFFLILGMLSIKNSRKGYKFSISRLLIYNSSFSLLLGILFFISGGAQWLEHIFDVKIESYESIRDKKIYMWSMPEDGYISGTIASINDSTLTLTDFKNASWTIEYSQAQVPPFLELKKGVEIKLIGKMFSAGYFKAEEIKPWGGNKRFEEKQEPKSNP